MRALIKLFILSAILLLPAQSIAGEIMAPPPAALFTDNDETSASIGLRFDFGDMKPQLVLSVSRTETDTDNDVTGIKADIAIPLDPDADPSAILRILGIFGNTDIQGVAGIGFDSATAQALLAAGVQIPYAEGGVNFGFDGSISPYIGVNSDDGPEDRRSVPAAVAPPADDDDDDGF